MLPHLTSSIQKRFLISIALTSFILIGEVVGGLWTGSLALLSDSAHVFMDIFALGLSFLALRLSSLPADDRHSYGYHRLEVLAALVNGLSLAGISIGIFIEAFRRFQSPEPIKSMEMLVIAAIGLVVNLMVAFVLGRSDHGHAHGHDHGDDHGHLHKDDVNVRSAYLHVIGDAVSSLGVILAAILLSVTGWQWVDPVVSVLIGLLILFSSGRVLRSSLHILIEGVPEGISLNKVRTTMGSVSGVADIHDLHIWNICSGHVALSAHVVVCRNDHVDHQSLMGEIKQRLSSGFAIDHTTIQFELSSCGEKPSVCRCM